MVAYKYGTSPGHIAIRDGLERVGQLNGMERLCAQSSGATTVDLRTPYSRFLLQVHNMCC